MIFAGKKVLVFGTGKSGIAAEDLLHKKGASVVLYDGNDKLEKEEILKKLESRLPTKRTVPEPADPAPFPSAEPQSAPASPPFQAAILPHLRV